MKTFIFQTGHAKGLAKTEILALFTSEENPNPIIDEVEDGFVVEADLQNPVAFLNRMGGIVRITEVIQNGPARMPLNFEEWVTKAVADIMSKGSKIRYGLSVHPKSEKNLKKTLIGSKKSLKEFGNVRFINKDFQNLSSVQAWHERLLDENATELHLFKSEENQADKSPEQNPDQNSKSKWYLTKTVAIQNFEAYSKRDYDRPARSAANGMFPPKLAQILINLALGESGGSAQDKNTHTQDEITIYDPFCGSGTVLQEAVLMGCKAMGSDLSEQMVKDSKENIAWLSTCKSLPGEGSQPVNFSNPSINIFQADATKLTHEQLPQEPFVIVTETWLGPVLTKPLTSLERPKVQREVEALYEKFFANLKNLVSKSEMPAVTMVFTAPYHRDGKDRHFLANLPKILAEHTAIIPLSDHDRPSLFFERKNQLVSREIWKVKVG